MHTGLKTALQAGLPGVALVSSSITTLLEEPLGVGDLQNAAHCLALVGGAAIKRLADLVADVISQVGSAVLGTVSLKQPSAEVRAQHIFPKLRPKGLLVSVP